MKRRSGSARVRRTPGFKSLRRAGSAALGLAALAGAEPADAATFIVTSTGDAGAGTLRQAILDANAAAGADVITFDLAPGPDTILLESGELHVTDSLEIRGPGRDLLSIDGNDDSGIFTITGPPAEIDVTISGVTMENGGGTDYYGQGALLSNFTNLTLEGVTIRNGVSSSIGGGILSNRGSLTLEDALVTGNTANDGGGVAAVETTSVTIRDSTISENVGGVGGGLLLVQSGTVTIVSSEIDGNQGVLGGGLAAVGNEDLTIRSSTITGNSADDGGGGALIVGYDPATSVIEDSLVSGNEGGGLFLVQSDFIVRGSTISGNRTSAEGGGIFAVPDTFLLESSTLYGNEGIDGGGLFLYSGVTTVRHATIASNSAERGGGIYHAGAGSVLLQNSIVADNVAPEGPDVFTSGGGAIDSHHSLIEQPAGATIVSDAGSLTGDPQLGPLQDNGGPTPTQMPAGSSPVIDAGDPALPFLPERDQRGEPRIAGAAPDMGAVENGAIAVDIPLFSPSGLLGTILSIIAIAFATIGRKIRA